MVRRMGQKGGSSMEEGEAKTEHVLKSAKCDQIRGPDRMNHVMEIIYIECGLLVSLSSSARLSFFD